jgi:hypothetical protein
MFYELINEFSSNQNMFCMETHFIQGKKSTKLPFPQFRHTAKRRERCLPASHEPRARTHRGGKSQMQAGKCFSGVGRRNNKPQPPPQSRTAH